MGLMEKGGNRKKVNFNTRLSTIGCLVFIIPLELRIEKTRLTRPVNLRCDMKIKKKRYGTFKLV